MGQRGAQALQEGRLSPGGSQVCFQAQIWVLCHLTQMSHGHMFWLHTGLVSVLEKYGRAVDPLISREGLDHQDRGLRKAAASILSPGR